MTEQHPGLLRLDFTQYLIRNPHLPHSNRTFRNFCNSRRNHLFKDWPKPEPLGSLPYCLSCGTPDSDQNPITADHMIPQVLTKYPDPLRERLRDEVVSVKQNLFSVCQKCHSKIDRFKIETLGKKLPQDPAKLFTFLISEYPITRGRNRLKMLATVQAVVDRYIDVIQQYLNQLPETEKTAPYLQPFIESVPGAYEFSGILYRERIILQAELDEASLDRVQSVA